MNVDFLGAIASQGFGYLLFAGSLLVLFFRDRQLREAEEKRVSDLLSARDVYMNALKDVLNSVSNLQKSVESMSEILQNTRIKGGLS